MPWSPGLHGDDRKVTSMDQFKDRRVIVTKKMDGENTSMYRSHFHARSVDSVNHSSRNLVKAFWGRLCGDIPEGWRLCGENLYARHSIVYDELVGYFYGFSIWNETNHRLCYEETVEWFNLLGIPMPEVLYDGVYNEEKIKALSKTLNWEKDEGWVLTVADQIHYSEFKDLVVKLVRKDHVLTSPHWMHGRGIIPNKLKE